MVLPINDLLVERQFSRSVETQATAAGTKTLTVASAPIHRFTGATAGQIVQLPAATTLLVGTLYEVINDSTAGITVRDGGVPTVLTTISQTRRARLTLIDNGTAAGVWSVDNNVFGANDQAAEGVVPVTNNSNTVYVTAVGITTPDLPLGTYEWDANVLWYGGNNGRAIDLRINDNGTPGTVYSFYGSSFNINAYLGAFAEGRLVGVSGIRTINAEFKNNGAVGNTTITVGSAQLRLKRVL
jgi:hypothetical protein